MKCMNTYKEHISYIINRIVNLIALKIFTKRKVYKIVCIFQLSETY